MHLNSKLLTLPFRSSIFSRMLIYDQQLKFYVNGKQINIYLQIITNRESYTVYTRRCELPSFNQFNISIVLTRKWYTVIGYCMFDLVSQFGRHRLHAVTMSVSRFSKSSCPRPWPCHDFSTLSLAQHFYWFSHRLGPNLGQRCHNKWIIWMTKKQRLFNDPRKHWVRKSQVYVTIGKSESPQKYDFDNFCEL